MTRFLAAAAAIALALFFPIDRIVARECTFCGVGSDTPLFTSEMELYNYVVRYFDATGEHIYV